MILVSHYEGGILQQRCAVSHQ